MTRQFISVMAYQEVNFPSCKISKNRSKYKIRKIYLIITSFNNLIGMGDYLLQRKGSESSHERNLACCQLEGRHLNCLSVRVIVKPFSQKTIDFEIRLFFCFSSMLYSLLIKIRRVL